MNSMRLIYKLKSKENQKKENSLSFYKLELLTDFDMLINGRERYQRWNIFCKSLSNYQRFRKREDKNFSLLESEVVSRKFKATMSVDFRIKITASIWKKQLTKINTVESL